MQRRRATPSRSTAVKGLRFQSLPHPPAPDRDVILRSSGRLDPTTAYRSRSPVASSITAPTVIGESYLRCAPSPERALEAHRIDDGDDLGAAEGLQALAVRRPAPAAPTIPKTIVKSEIGGSSSLRRVPRKGSQFFDGMTFSLKMTSNGNKSFRCITRCGGRVRSSEATDSAFDILDSELYTKTTAVSTIRAMLSAPGRGGESPLPMPERWIDECAKRQVMVPPATWLAEQYGLVGLPDTKLDLSDGHGAESREGGAKQRHAHAYLPLLTLVVQTDWSHTTALAFRAVHPSIDGVSTENLLRIFNAELRRDCAAYAERRCQGKRPRHPSGCTHSIGRASEDSGYSPPSATDNSTEPSDGSPTHIDDNVYESSASAANDSDAHEADASSSDRTIRHASFIGITTDDPGPSRATVPPDFSVVDTNERETIFLTPESIPRPPSPRLSTPPFRDPSPAPHTESLSSERACGRFKRSEPAQSSNRGRDELSLDRPALVPVSRPRTMSALKRPLGIDSAGEETHPLAKAAKTGRSSSPPRLDVDRALASTFFFRPYRKASWSEGVPGRGTLAIERSTHLLNAWGESQLHNATSTSGLGPTAIRWRGACAVLGLDPAAVGDDPVASGVTDDNADNDEDDDDAASDFVELSLVLAMNELQRRLRAFASRWTVLPWADLAAIADKRIVSPDPALSGDSSGFLTLHRAVSGSTTLYKVDIGRDELVVQDLIGVAAPGDVSRAREAAKALMPGAVVNLARNPILPLCPLRPSGSDRLAWLSAWMTFEQLAWPCAAGTELLSEQWREIMCMDDEEMMHRAVLAVLRSHRR